MIVGFDPGLSGGIAFVSNDGALIDCQDLPVIGEGTQRRIDAANLAAIIRSHTPTRAVIEAVGARVKDHNRAEAALLALWSIGVR